MSNAKEVASAIVKSGFWPDANANAVLMLCYLAEAEGHHPAVVYRDYHIMQGKPAKKAEAILRDFVAAGGKIKWHRLDDECADATFTHSSGEARIAWDLERARKANLKSPMWSKYPRQMLRSRTISEGVRTVFPGATSGLYEEGEVADIVADDATGGGQGQSEEREVSPDAPTEKKGWREPDSIYSTPSKLHAGLNSHSAELRRIGDEGVMDDLEGYQASPEYQEFIRVADIHAPHYLEGGPPLPEEYDCIFALEQRARDLIGIRGNQPMEKA